MRHRLASEHIVAARVNIRQATQICGAANAARLQRVLEFLKASAMEMRQAEAAVRAGLLSETEVRRENALLQREIACMMRAMDGCAALQRSRAVRLGCAPLTYSPQGRLVTTSPSTTACEMQG